MRNSRWATDDGTSFTFTDRVYVTQDANYNVTALISDVNLEADANNDGEVDALDLSILAENFGNYVSGGCVDSVL